jgi:hypothetical protein
VLERLVAETNTRLLRQKPTLSRQRRVLQRNLDEVNAEAGGLLSDWPQWQSQEGRVFFSEKLAALGQRRSDLERGLLEAEEKLRQLEDRAVTAEGVRRALADAHQVYDQLKPFEQKELMRLVLHRAEVGDKEIVLEVYGGIGVMTAEAPEGTLGSSPRFQTQNWLPE